MRTSSDKYALLFALIAGGCCVAAWNSSSQIAVPLLAFTGLAFAVTALAYRRRTPALLGKRPDGRIGLSHAILLFPFHLLCRLSLIAFCVSNRSAAFHPILPGLILGRRLSAREARDLPVNCVLDLTSEFPEAAPLRSKLYRSVPMLDGVSPTLEQFDDAVRTIQELISLGPTYVHCALGHSRSAMVVIAYLVASGRARSVAEGLQFLQAQRSAVRLSRGQSRVLDDWVRLNCQIA